MICQSYTVSFLCAMLFSLNGTGKGKNANSLQYPLLFFTILNCFLNSSRLEEINAHVQEPFIYI